MLGTQCPVPAAGCSQQVGVRSPSGTPHSPLRSPARSAVLLLPSLHVLSPLPPHRESHAEQLLSARLCPHARVCGRVCRKMALPTLPSCIRITAATANGFVFALHRWPSIDLGGGGDLLGKPPVLLFFFFFCFCRREKPPPARLAAEIQIRPQKREKRRRTKALGAAQSGQATRRQNPVRHRGHCAAAQERGLTGAAPRGHGGEPADEGPRRAKKVGLE